MTSQRPASSAVVTPQPTSIALAATADADAAAIWQRNLDNRRRGMVMFARELAEAGCPRPELDVGAAADVRWLAMDVRNYDWLVRRRGWSVAATPAQARAS